MLSVLCLDMARIWRVSDRLEFLGVLELDLALVGSLLMNDGALEVDLALVGSLSMSDGAGWVCVLHWGLDDVALCE